MHKPRWAIFTASGCRGCENLLLDVHYQVAPISDLADVVFWPYVLGSKWEDLEADPEAAIDVAFVAGAVRTAGDEGAVWQLRARARHLVAVGACAHMGGMPALAEVSPSLVGGPLSPPVPPTPQFWGESPCGTPVPPRIGGPGGPIAGEGGTLGELPALPEVSGRARSLDQVVPVDYSLPGCPPPLNFAWAAMEAFAGQHLSPARLGFLNNLLPPEAGRAIAAGVRPPQGTVFAGPKAVCATCSRIKEEKKITAFRRPHAVAPDPERCLLEQGIVCCGIATRGGCGGRCTAAGLPCRGCFGPAEEVVDPGAKLVSAISSTIASDEPTEIKKISEGLVDPVGTFYRYSLAKALLRPRPRGT